MFTALVHTLVVQLLYGEEEQSGMGTRRPSWDRHEGGPATRYGDDVPGIKTRMFWNADTI